jgi:hypothetical protein
MTTETKTQYTLCVRRWFDKANGNSYYSMRIIGQGKDFIVPFEYGHSESTYKYHASELLGIDWGSMDWEQRREVFTIEEIKVPRRKDLHSHPKPDQA